MPRPCHGSRAGRQHYSRRCPCGFDPAAAKTRLEQIDKQLKDNFNSEETDELKAERERLVQRSAMAEGADAEVKSAQAALSDEDKKQLATTGAGGLEKSEKDLLAAFDRHNKAKTDKNLAATRRDIAEKIYNDTANKANNDTANKANKEALTDAKAKYEAAQAGYQTAHQEQLEADYELTMAQRKHDVLQFENLAVLLRGGQGVQGVQDAVRAEIASAEQQVESSNAALEQTPNIEGNEAKVEEARLAHNQAQARLHQSQLAKMALDKALEDAPSQAIELSNDEKSVRPPAFLYERWHHSCDDRRRGLVRQFDCLWTGEALHQRRACGDPPSVIRVYGVPLHCHVERRVLE